MIENVELLQVLTNLRKDHDQRALTLATALHMAAVHMPQNPAAVAAMSQLAAGMAALGCQRGVSPTQLAQAFAAVEAANQTMAYLSGLPE